MDREMPQCDWERNIVDRDWLRTLTDADLADFIRRAWQSSSNANRLGMADAYNHHRFRARAGELEVERRASASLPCPACQGRGQDEYRGIVLPQVCARCHGTGTCR